MVTQTNVDSAAPLVNAASCSSCESFGDQLYAPDRTIAFDVIASDEGGSGVELVKISLAGGDGEATILYGNVLEYTLPNEENVYTYSVDVWLVDYAGNVSEKETFTINLDNTPPEITELVTVTPTAGYTTTAGLLVRFSVSDDVVSYRLSNTAVFVGSGIPFMDDSGSSGTYASMTVPWDVAAPDVDGAKNIYLEVMDNAGNTQTSSVGIILDTIAPTGTLTLAEGAAYFNGLDSNGNTIATTNLEIEMPADTAAFAIVNGIVNCETVEASVYSVGVGTLYVDTAYTLVSSTVSVCMRDAAGNLGMASDTIIIDTQPPTVAVAINGGAPYANSTNVTLALSASETIAAIAIGDDNLVCEAADTDYTLYAFSSVIADYPVSSADGGAVVKVCFRDLAGHLVEAQTSIIVDTTAPQATLVVDGGKTYTSNTSVPLELLQGANPIAAFEDIVAVSAANSSMDCNAVTYTDISMARPIIDSHALDSATDGSKTVFVCLKDASGLTTQISGSIILDTTSPSGTVTLAGGATFVPVGDAYAINTNISLTHDADVSGEYALAVNNEPLDCSLATYEAIGNFPATVELGREEGTRLVKVCLRDTAGLVSMVSDTIIHDTNPPSNVSVSIDGGAPYTSSETVTLTLAGDDIDSIAIGERSVLDCGTADYSLYPYSVTIADYPLQNDADGLEYLEVCFKDLAGNVTSAVASITKDTTAPNGELVLNNADAYTTSVYVDVTLRQANNADLDDIDSISLDTEAMDCSEASYSPIVPSSFAFNDFELAAGDGSKTVYACLKDKAGLTNLISETIILDTQTPSATVTLAGGAEYISNDVASTSDGIQVDVAWSSLSADVSEIKFGDITTTACAEAGGYQPVADYGTGQQVNFSLYEGEKTVILCLKDNAGLVASVTDTVVYDITPPSGSIVINSDDVITTDANVVITFSDVSSDVVSYAISQGSSVNCALASYTSYTTDTIAYAIAGGSGLPQIAVCFKDAAGLTSPAHDGIILDLDAPVINGMLVTGSPNDVSGYTTNQTVRVQLNVTELPSTAGLEMQVSEDSGFADVSWESFDSLRVFTLTPQNGSKTVYARLRDQAGVMSATASTTIVYDDIDPVLLGVNGDYELIPLTGCAYAERGTGSCEEDASMKHFFSEGETTIPLVVTDNLNGDLQVGTAIDEYGHTCGSNAVTYYNYENGRVVINSLSKALVLIMVFSISLCV